MHTVSEYGYNCVHCSAYFVTSITSVLLGFKQELQSNSVSCPYDLPEVPTKKL